MTATLSRLPAAKQPSEESVKIHKVLVYLLESRRIHFPTSPGLDRLYFPLTLSANCRCNTSRGVDSASTPP